MARILMKATACCGEPMEVARGQSFRWSRNMKRVALSDVASRRFPRIDFPATFTRYTCAGRPMGSPSFERGTCAPRRNGQDREEFQTSLGAMISEIVEAPFP